LRIYLAGGTASTERVEQVRGSRAAVRTKGASRELLQQGFGLGRATELDEAKRAIEMRFHRQLSFGKRGEVRIPRGEGANWIFVLKMKLMGGPIACKIGVLLRAFLDDRRLVRGIRLPRRCRCRSLCVD
jgi:hypothetical protein